jgi:glycosyltransferase involved in cell wall biosynthesis
LEPDRIVAAPRLSEYAVYAQRRDEEQPAAWHPPPLVTIITVTLNAVATVGRTIASVQRQAHPVIEHVFVDGSSSDGTYPLVRNAMRVQDYAISEKDRGISDAFNKGVAMARGRYVQILNADDWLSPRQIANAIRMLRSADADFVFGDLIFYEAGTASFTYTGDPNYAMTIHRRMPAISHPTVLVARKWFEQIGLFDLSYRTAMDYDWLLRLHRAGARGVHCSDVVGHMTYEGVSNRQFRRTIEEVRRIAVAHGRHPMLATAEAKLRYVKTLAAQPIRKRARPLYSQIRRAINPSFRPVSPHPSRTPHAAPLVDAPQVRRSDAPMRRS